MGKFEAGKPRHPNAGRKKGTPNKSSLDLVQKCIDRGVDVFDELLQIALTTTQPFERFKMFSEIATYIYAKRKALEVEASVDMELGRKAKEYSELNKEEQLQLLRAEIKRLERS